MRRALPLLVVGAAVAWWFWPTDYRRIVAATAELAEAASIPAGEKDLARVARAAVLSRLLAEDFTLQTLDGRVLLDGRESAVGLATRLQPPQGLVVTIDTPDPQFDEEGSTASAEAQATLREPASPGGTPTREESRRLRFWWVERERWVLVRVELLDAGEPR